MGHVFDADLSNEPALKFIRSLNILWHKDEIKQSFSLSDSRPAHECSFKDPLRWRQNYSKHCHQYQARTFPSVHPRSYTMRFFLLMDLLWSLSELMNVIFDWCCWSCRSSMTVYCSVIVSLSTYWQHSYHKVMQGQVCTCILGTETFNCRNMDIFQIQICHTQIFRVICAYINIYALDINIYFPRVCISGKISAACMRVHFKKNKRHMGWVTVYHTCTAWGITYM